MKKIYSLIAAVLLTATVWAQSPNKMSYQAVVRDANNELVSNSSIGMQISILQGSANGISVYSETQTPTSNGNGLVSVEIGTGSTSDDFSAIDWAAGPYFIKTETDPTGGSNYTITGTSQLMSVPFALYAKIAESITGTITETDPVFGASIANGIIAADTTNWNKHTVDTDTHLDAAGVTALGFVSGAHTVDTNTQLDEAAVDAFVANNGYLTQAAATVAYVDELYAKMQADIKILTYSYQLTDNDGNLYNVVRIGAQVWMAEDLKVTTYPNGDPIPEITDLDLTNGVFNEWGADLANINEDDAYAFSPITGNNTTSGAYYSFGAALNACPTDWHLPSQNEWTQLLDYVDFHGNSGVVSEALSDKSMGFGATDVYYFAAKTNSGLDHAGSGDLGESIQLWSSTEFAIDKAIIQYMFPSGGTNQWEERKSAGLKVRCLRDY